MKKYLITALPILLTFALNSQVKPDFQTFRQHKSTIELKGIGGPMIDFSGTKDGFAILMGGGGAISINKNLFIGGFGYSAIGGLNPDGLTSEDGYKDYFEYGGIWMGYIFKPNEVLHPVIDLKVGWGNAAIENIDEGTTTNFTAYVVKPSFELEMNVARFMKMGFDVHYRHVSEIDMTTGTTPAIYNYSGTGIGLSFKFGWFD